MKKYLNDDKDTCGRDLGSFGICDRTKSHDGPCAQWSRTSQNEKSNACIVCGGTGKALMDYSSQGGPDIDEPCGCLFSKNIRRSIKLSVLAKLRMGASVRHDDAVPVFTREEYSYLIDSFIQQEKLLELINEQSIDENLSTYWYTRARKLLKDSI